MNAKDVLKNGLALSDRFIQAYVSDLSDADLLVRPVPGMNHIAWQLGHLIDTERVLVDLIKPGSSPALPAGFEEGHGRKMFTVDDPSKFYSAAKYLELWKAQREATLRVLDSLSEADLDKTNEKFPAFAPSVGAILTVCGSHPAVHAGQFVAVRRLLNKPISI